MDKVTVLYEGQQIFFGPAETARSYFERLGFECPASQTTPDFLTSMTSPSERRIRQGYENTTPRNSDDFARCCKDSPERQQLLRDIEQYDKAHSLSGADHEKFALSRTIEKSRKQRQKSPYTLSYFKQIKLCMWREVTKLKNDPSVPIVMLTINFFEALIIASIFYNLREATESFFMRGGVLFMMVSNSSEAGELIQEYVLGLVIRMLTIANRCSSTPLVACWKSCLFMRSGQSSRRFGFPSDYLDSTTDIISA